MTETRARQFKLIVNRADKEWPKQFITGSEIKTLAESPADWVVNQLVPGRGEDPEVGDDLKVDLEENAPPKGAKRFTTRKPVTSPGR